ncbi:MAG: DNA-3-methyladenine glycosylase [Planctomycetota bacterium]|nr:DNA-3-methyladenine glycosylase [Planctomycetota bacterium]
MTARLPRSFFRRDSVTLARALLGQRLVRVHRGQRLAGLIVETEAYLGVEDRAAHTFGGRRTPRNAAMWLDGGHAYVYFIYGLHFCLNVVAGRAEEPIAVLIRALEPVEGLPAMFESRGPRVTRPEQLCSGPARLCQALAIDRALDGVDLVTSQELFIEGSPRHVVPDADIVASARIGVAYAGDWADKPLRFHLRGHAHVSRP